MTMEQERAAQEVWIEKSEIRRLVDENSSREVLGDEAQQILETLTTFLIYYERKLRVYALYKR